MGFHWIIHEFGNSLGINMVFYLGKISCVCLNVHYMTCLLEKLMGGCLMGHFGIPKTLGVLCEQFIKT